MNEMEILRTHGLVPGGSVENAIVFADRGILDEEGLRYEDEFARHKLCDAMGDVALLGMPLVDEFRAHESGHTLSNGLLRALLAQPEAWNIVRQRRLADSPPAAAAALASAWA